jgi:hypothetical protein
MTRPKLTPAQQRALDWLPANGAWRQLLGDPSEPSERTLYRLRCINLVCRLPQHRYRISDAGLHLFHPAPDPVGEKP